MTVKLTKNNIPKNIFDQVRKEFTKDGKNARDIKKAILEDMSAGVSPVRGERWKKYSQSYKDVIRGLATFRKGKDGKVRFSPTRDQAFMDLATIGGGKSVSPVNLKLTGTLWKSLKISTTGRLIIVAFEDALAIIHNQLGAGKSKAIRRLLPTEPNEKFNENITQVVENGVKNAVDIVVKKVNRQ